MSNDDPKDSLFEFLSTLPETIREGCTRQIASMYAGITMDSVEKAEGAISEAFNLREPLADARAVILLCAACDHVLMRTALNAGRRSQYMKAFALETGNEEITAGVRNEPVRSSQVAQTREKWAALRSGPLSPENLVGYENKILTDRVLLSR